MSDHQPSTAFDFFMGRWTVHHRRLARILDAECTDWWEFDGTSDARPMLGGWGNVDEVTGTFPTGQQFRGMSVRLYEPEADTWRIWWASTGAPGVLDEPVAGRFDGTAGTFEGPIAPGVEGVCRYEWDVADPDRPVWRQMFSYDDGRTFGEPNWVMQFLRA